MSASSGCSPAGLGPGLSMFRWLEVLEKEFDKAFVDVDLLLGEIDPDQVDITYEGRQKMTTLSSCFAQLCHKSQTVFQLNHKLEVSGLSFVIILNTANEPKRLVKLQSNLRLFIVIFHPSLYKRASSYATHQKIMVFFTQRKLIFKF